MYQYLYPNRDTNFYAFQCTILRKKRTIVKKIHIGKYIQNWKFILRSHANIPYTHDWSSYKQFLTSDRFSIIVKDDMNGKHSVWSLISLIENTKHNKSHVEFFKDFREIKNSHQPFRNMGWEFDNYASNFFSDYNEYEFRHSSDHNTFW